MKSPKSFFAPLALVSCIFYFLAIFSLFPGPTLNATVPAVPRDVALAVCSLGVLSALGWFAYVRKTATRTVQAYFSRMSAAFVIMGVSLLAWYVDSIIARLGSVDRSQMERLIALNGVLTVAIVYQFIRGMMSVRSQWKTSTDVVEFVRRSRVVGLREAKMHDYAFYGGVMIVFNVIGQTLNVQVLFLHICGVGLALIMPHVCGSVIARWLIVRRISPNDALLPADLQSEGAP